MMINIIILAIHGEVMVNLSSGDTGRGRLTFSNDTRRRLLL